MSLISDRILRLTKRLFPTGRAFNVSQGSWKEAVYEGLILSEERAYSDMLSILNSILPDNPFFLESDADRLEKIYGLSTTPGTSLTDRNLALIRKINYPGKNKARQHYLYLQEQMRLAGFDVYVHENLSNLTPQEVIGIEYNALHSITLQHGQVQHGTRNAKLLVNSIDENIDSLFFLGSSYENVIFIGGQILGDYANIPSVREKEFRHLFLRLKPIRIAAILLINYT